MSKDVYCQDLKCGDVILLNNEEFAPADIVIIASTGQKGQCFVETKSLDGETNLKIKATPKALVPKEIATLPNQFNAKNF